MSGTQRRPSDFSAKEPALGYFYQVKFAMKLLLDAESPSAKVLIESLDDIQLERPDGTVLYQTKFHKNRTGRLTDRSKDFWKTIRVWSTLVHEHQIETSETQFILVSTEVVASSSIFSKLKTKDDIKTLVSEMDGIAAEQSEQNSKGYSAWRTLTQEQKKSLLEKVNIADGSIDFLEMETEIKKKLRLTTTPDRIDSLIGRLSGWWLEQSIQQIYENGNGISSEALLNKIFHINDQLKSDNLPIDFPTSLKLTEDAIAIGMDQKYIRQLKLIGMGGRQLQVAMSDYIRAFNQRSKWIREDLLNPNEDIAYDNRLHDYWHRKFQNLLDDTDDKTEDQKVQFGKSFYISHFLEHPPNIYIRDRCTDEYIILGSFQILSDLMRIGWHPNYENQIR